MTPKIFTPPTRKLHPTWEHLILESRYEDNKTVSFRLNNKLAKYDKASGFCWESDAGVVFLGTSWPSVLNAIGALGWGCYSAYHSDVGHVFYFQRVRCD